MSYLQPFGRGGAVERMEEKSDFCDDLINEECVGKAVPSIAWVV